MYQTNQERKRCRICFVSLLEHQSYIEILFGHDTLCHDCRRQLNPNPQRIRVESMEIETLFSYEAQARQWFLQFKEGHDIQLGPIFLYGSKRKMRRKYRNYQIIYAPSHENSVKNRGFNVLETMMKDVFHTPSIPVFTKKNDVYQKSLNREERFKNTENFHADLTLLDKKKKILLVDDLVTTGATLSILSQTLTKKGYNVQIFSVYRHKTLES